MHLIFVHLKRFFKILKNTLLISLGLLVCLAVLVNTAPVQNYLSRQAAKFLSKKLNTTVAIRNLRIHLFNNANLEGLYIADQRQDTLLYAGNARIRLTDWFLGGKIKTIHYIGLENAQIHLHRFKDKDEWNYAFIAAAFQKKNKGSESDDSAPTEIKWALEKIKLESVHFFWQDEWVGTDYEAYTKNLVILPQSIDLKGKIIKINSIKGANLLFGITEYTGGRPPRPRSKNPFPIDTVPFNPNNWQFSFSHLQISDSRFYLEYPEDKAPEGLFDENHLNITGITADIHNISIKGDTISGHVAKLTAKERCGLTIQNMQADVSVSPILSSCKNLYLQTNNSSLSGYYKMHYDRFPDFIDYINKVKMEGYLKNSEIGIRDISYFAPELKRMNNLSIKVSGNGSGTVARLSGHNLLLDDGFSTLSGSLVMNGLPDIDQTYMDFRDVHLHTSGAAALFYAPELKEQNAVYLQALSSVDFSGNYTGFIRDFVAYGTIKTNLGNLEADLNMKLPKNERASYSGSLNAENFACGILLNQQTIGRASFSVKVNGVGFNPHTLKANLDGAISNLAFNNYNYRSLTINGAFDKQLFNGTLTVEDPNAQFDFNGQIDFSKESPLYQFNAVVNRLNFKPLNFSKDSIQLSAGLHINMEGSNLDYITGSAFLTDINLLRNSKRLNIDTLLLNAQILEGDIHQLTLQTNNARAQLKGRFYPTDLLNAGRIFLSYYLPEYVSPPETFGRSHDIHFQIDAGDISDILSLINPDIGLKGAAIIDGQLDLSQQSLQLTGSITGLSYGKLKAQTADLSGTGNFSGLNLNLSVQNIQAGTDNILSNLKIATRLFRDTANFNIETTSPTTFEKASLNGIALARQDSLYMSLTPSQFNFNNALWKIPSGNEFILAKKFISIQNLNIHSGNQSIEINPKGAEKKGNNAFVRLKNIDLSPLNSFINLNGNKLNGILNGNLMAYALLDTSRLDFQLQANHVMLQKDTLGTVLLNGSYRAAKKQLILKENSGIHNKSGVLALAGMVEMRPHDTVMLDGKAVLDNAQLSWIAPFLEGYAHNIGGTASGEVFFSGEASRLKTKGTLWLSQATFSPDITGVTYNIPQGKIQVANNTFNLDSIEVFDPSGHSGILLGEFSHKGFGNFYFNLRMYSNHLKVLNQNQIQNNYFYGDIDAKVNMTLRGPWEDLNMHVIATPLLHSQLFITVDNSSDLGSYKYINFRENSLKHHEIKQSYSNKFNFVLDAVVNPNLETTLVLDPETGERIWAKGNGNLILEIPSEGAMKMNGNYVISEGTYNFSFRQLQILNYKRQFIINSNSSIKWNGGLTDADLDVSAHTAVKARLYDLISGETELLHLSDPEIRDAQIRQNVDILMNMKGSLNKPELSFKLQLAEGRSIGTYAYQKLQRINTDEKQTLIQVSSLLLLGQFVPPEGINSTAISSGTINNMSELVSSVVSSQITNFANKLLGMEDLSVGVKYKNYSMSEANQLNSISYFNRNEAEVNLRKNFLNDRLIVEVGGVYDWGQAGAIGNYTANLAGDFRIQYLLVPDGRVRFSIFRTSDYDPLYSLKAIGRQGVNLSYRKSFNNLKGFFASHPKPKTKTKLPLNPKVEDSTQLPLDPVKQNLIKEAMTTDSLKATSIRVEKANQLRTKR